MIRLFARIAILQLLLGSMTGTGANAGEIVKEDIATMKGGLPAYKTVSADRLSAEQSAALAKVFEVAPERIAKFRWGPIMAPPGSPNAGASFFTLWHGIGTAQTEVTLRFSPSGTLLNRADALPTSPQQSEHAAGTQPVGAVAKSRSGSGTMAATGQKPLLEISTNVGLGITWLSGGDLDGNTVTLPASDIQGASTISASLFVGDRLALEPQFYFFRSSSDDCDATAIALGGNVMYLVEGAQRNSPYVSGQGVLIRTSAEDFDAEVDSAARAGFGYRMLVREILAVRFEGAYRRWFDLESNEFSFKIAFGAVLPGGG